ncbi:putative nuclease HARBI1 [Mya arenaria]|uniref:putative nuclease HARBI1 n=1 Tax=Mya arenaria TaxID=6604 RepID=UPI0022E3180C|nr:putative nuclease HARBI1 [Mya arenaria]
MAAIYGVLYGQRRNPVQQLFHPRLAMVGLRDQEVLLTLRYLAKRDFFSEVRDIHGVSKSPMSRHLHDVVLAINNRVDNIRFIDAVVRWPGATNDATIFEMSGLKDYLEANAVGVLLGDSGYALRNYVLTPILRPTANAKMANNDAHARGRVVVERAFGVLKSRFKSV